MFCTGTMSAWAAKVIPMAVGTIRFRSGSYAQHLEFMMVLLSNPRRQWHHVQGWRLDGEYRHLMPATGHPARRQILQQNNGTAQGHRQPLRIAWKQASRRRIRRLLSVRVLDVLWLRTCPLHSSLASWRDATHRSHAGNRSTVSVHGSGFFLDALADTRPPSRSRQTREGCCRDRELDRAGRPSLAGSRTLIGGAS